MSKCGRKSTCKTSRCICKADGKQCQSFCKVCGCDDEICSNTIESCVKSKCGCKKTKCSNNQCACKKNGIFCSSDCCCEDCENNNSSQVYTVNDRASLITENIRVSVTNKKHSVLKFRGNKDIYTNIVEESIINPQVDHIIEDQLIGHATAISLGNNQSYAPFLNSLKGALNLETLENYNVTSDKINASKGSIIKSYLRDKRNEGFPLRSLIKLDSPLGRNMEPVFKAMNDSFPVVEEYVRDGTRSDGHITGENTFISIADNLVQIFNDMDLDLNRRTRRKSYSDQVVKYYVDSSESD